MAIKYEATGPHGWSLEVFIENGQAYDVVKVGMGKGAISYAYEARRLIGPELRLLAMAGGLRTELWPIADTTPDHGLAGDVPTIAVNLIGVRGAHDK